MLSSGVSFLKNHLREETYEEFYKTARDKFEINYGMKVKELLLTEELQVTKPLSLGVFGSGVLVQHKKSKAQFIMKVFDKERLLKEDCVRVLLKEKRLLSACRFPFILEVSHCLQARFPRLSISGIFLSINILGCWQFVLSLSSKDTRQLHL